jgi:hypothetical protein
MFALLNLATGKILVVVENFVTACHKSSAMFIRTAAAARLLRAVKYLPTNC